MKTADNSSAADKNSCFCDGGPSQGNPDAPMLMKGTPDPYFCGIKMNETGRNGHDDQHQDRKNYFVEERFAAHEIKMHDFAESGIKTIEEPPEKAS
jgi:hypothetical protein